MKYKPGDWLICIRTNMAHSTPDPYYEKIGHIILLVTLERYKEFYNSDSPVTKAYYFIEPYSNEPSKVWVLSYREDIENRYTKLTTLQRLIYA